VRSKSAVGDFVSVSVVSVSLMCRVLRFVPTCSLLSVIIFLVLTDKTLSPT